MKRKMFTSAKIKEQTRSIFDERNKQMIKCYEFLYEKGYRKSIITDTLCSYFQISQVTLYRNIDVKDIESKIDFKLSESLKELEKCLGQ